MSLRSRFLLTSLLALAACGHTDERADWTRLPVHGLHEARPWAVGLVLPTGPDAARALVSGWRAPVLAGEELGDAPWAPMAGPRAELRFAARGEARTLRLELTSMPWTEGRQRVALELNGTSLGEHPVALGAGTLEVGLAAGSLRPGTNLLTLATSVADPARGGEPRPPLGLVSLSLPEELGPEAATDRAALAEHQASVAAADGLGSGALYSAPALAFAGASLELAGWATGEVELSLAFVPDAVDGATGAWTERVTLEAGPFELTDLAPATTTMARGQLVVEARSGDGLVQLERASLATDGNPPSLILISVDTLRGDRVATGAGGSDGTAGEGTAGDGTVGEDLGMPSLESLAERGAVFTQAFTHVPMTLPAHTSLFSSRLPYVTGVIRNGQAVDRGLPLLAEWLLEAGYDTRAATAIGTLWAPAPGSLLDRGFRVYEDQNGLAVADVALERCLLASEGVDPGLPYFLFLHFSDPHVPYNAHGSGSNEVTIELDGEPLATLDVSDMKDWEERLSLEPGAHRLVFRGEHSFFLRHLDARTGGGAEVPGRYTEGARMRPFQQVVFEFAWPEAAAGREVHLSAWLSDDPDDAEKLRRYDLEVEHLDERLETLFAELDARGLLQDALVVFTSDHGEALGEHGWIGHAHQVYDPSMHVPLIVSPPPGSPFLEVLRSREAEVVRLVDVVPTVLDLMALPPLPGQMGRSLLEDAERVQYGEARPRGDKTHTYSFRDERTMLIYRAHDDAFEMYDLVADPGQQIDVFAERGGERADWQALLKEIAAGRLDGASSASEDPEMAGHLEALGYL